MLTYRIYGPSHGTSSFRAVTRGFLEGLHGLGREAWLYPTDLFSDEERETRGGKATVGIWCGFPAGIGALALALHRHKFVMVAPNSTITPPFLFDKIRRAGAEILTPSGWGRGVIEAQTGVRPMVVPHGVLGEFRRSDSLYANVPLPSRRGFGRSVLHITSTTGDRKGTLELVRAWMILRDRGAVKDGDSLTIACDDAGFVHLARSMAPEFYEAGVGLRVARAAPGTMRAFYRSFDLVVQPSRAEGFGMAPLEALAAGVPAVASRGTGHDEWAYPGIPRCTVGLGPRDEYHMIGVPELTVLPIATGSLAPIDDYEGSEAPSITALSIAEALRVAFEQLPDLQDRAEARQESVFRSWSWPRAIRAFVEHIERT